MSTLLFLAFAVSADPIATDFTWPIKPFVKYRKDQEMFGFLEEKGKYHFGEDWNRIYDPNQGEDSNIDFGDPVYSVGDGRVVRVYNIDYKDPWGKVLVIANTLPNLQILYSVYAHLKQIDVVLGEVVRKGERVAAIGNANGYYTDANGSSAHLHFAIMWRGPFPPDVKAYESKVEVSKALDYCIPTLFIESRWDEVETAQDLYFEASWQTVKPHHPAPFATAYVSKGKKTYSLIDAVDRGIVKGRFKGTDGHWYEMVNLTSAYFYTDTTIQFKTRRTQVSLHYFPLNWGEELVELHARQAMILAADQLNKTGIYKVKQIEMRQFAFGPGFPVYRAEVPIIATGGVPDEFVYLRYGINILGWNVVPQMNGGPMGFFIFGGNRLY